MFKFREIAAMRLCSVPTVRGWTAAGLQIGVGAAGVGVGNRRRSCGVASGQSRVLVCLSRLPRLSLLFLYPCYPGQRNRKCANESFAAVRVSGTNIAQLTRTRANNYKTLAVWALNVLAPPSMTRRKSKI